MTRTAIDGFLSNLASDPQLKRELCDLAGGQLKFVRAELLVELGTRHGCEFSLEDLCQHPNVRPRELTAEELDNVSAGSADKRSYVAGRFLLDLDG